MNLKNKRKIEKRLLAILLVLLVGVLAYDRNIYYYSHTVSPHVLVMTTYATGSGTYIGPNRIITAKHVVWDTTDGIIRIVDQEGHLAEAEGILVYSGVDAVLLMVDAPKKPRCPTTVRSTIPKVGEVLHYWGTPLFGYYGLLYREGKVMRADGHMIQLDATVEFGDSGAVVYDRRNRIVGIVDIKAGIAGWCGVLPVGRFIELVDSLEIQ